MKEAFERESKLFFSNELLLSRIYLYWSLFSFFIFVFLGIVPTAYNFSKKIGVYQELRGLNYQMNLKLKALSDTQDLLVKVQPYMVLLDRTLPKSLATHEYMVSFMQDAGLSGFIVKSFNSAEAENGGVPLTIVLEGRGSLPDLISRVESAQRVTIIDNVKLENHANSIDSQVTINLRIFNY